jgi:hypothetical protein
VSGLHPRLREVVSKTELALIEQGRCPWIVFRSHCGEQSDPESAFGYCPGHERRNQAGSADPEVIT